MNFDQISQLFTYDAKTGDLFWLRRPRQMFKTHRAFVQWNQRYAGIVAGTLKNDSGYVVVSIQKRLCRAHHVIWCLAHKEWPTAEIDHINGVRNDNRLVNLRLVSRAENTKNRCLLPSNKTGYHGVTKSSHGKYRAKGHAENVQRHLGYFNTLEEAVQARKDFEQAFGFHSNHGRAHQGVTA